MKITQDIREYAQDNGIDNYDEAISIGLDEKSKEFKMLGKKIAKKLSFISSFFLPNTASRACVRSSIISSTFSIPIDNLTKSSGTPAFLILLQIIVYAL